jgi:hypothetical protein
MQINVSYDQNASSLPAGFISAVNYAVNNFDTLFTANVTITLHVGYGEIGPNNTPLGSGALGESSVLTYVAASYSSVIGPGRSRRIQPAGEFPALGHSLYVTCRGAGLGRWSSGIGELLCRLQ